MASRHEDLITFKLMAELNQLVWKLTSRPPASRDQRFCANIKDAVNSAERNVPEGFGRFMPGDFAHFLDYSRASAQETKNQLLKGYKAGYFTKEEFQKADRLAARALTALANFQRYLRSPQARRNAERIRAGFQHEWKRNEQREPSDRPQPRKPPELREHPELNEPPEPKEPPEREEPPRTSRTSRTPRTSGRTGPFE